MTFYKVLLFSAIALAGTVIYYFLIGLKDGSVSARNIGLWIIILAAVGVVIGGGITLHYKGQDLWSKIILALLAVPAWLALFYLLIIVFSGSRWN